MPNSDYQFSESEVIKLKMFRDQCQDYRLRERYIALILVATVSMSSLQISEIIGKSKRTIDNWLSKYITEGIESFCHFNYKPKESFLKFYQKNQIKIYVSFDNPETTKEVADYINIHFGIQYSIEGTRKILKNLGLKVMKTKVIPDLQLMFRNNLFENTKLYEMNQIL